MPKAKILDTNVLIDHWYRFAEHERRTPASLQAHAEELIEVQGTRLIVSPVLIEFLAGALTSNELDLYRAYLAPFGVLDRGNIPRQDWEEAKRAAQWIRNEGRKRRLGDCLIQAIAGRLNCDVITSDPDFRPRTPPR
jgi:predicted nucleic acid-binding protein